MALLGRFLGLDYLLLVVVLVFLGHGGVLVAALLLREDFQDSCRLLLRVLLQIGFVCLSLHS